MSEPASSTAAGIAGWKFIGGAAGALGTGAALATVVVMCMTPPRSKREWAVALISTVVLSIAGGAGLVEYFNLHLMVFRFSGLLSLLGMCFACGLPGWAIVRWIFNYLEKRRAFDALEVAGELRKTIGGGA